MKRNKFLKTLLGLPFVAPLLAFSKPKPEAVVFTPEMLKRHNYGLYVINVKATDVTQNPGYAATVSWKLVWNFEKVKNPVFKGGGGEVFTWAKYSMCNFLTDGWVFPIGDSYEDVCEYLNNNPHGEQFRLMTKEEVIYLITNRQQGFL